jgi:hypothetical protein
LYPLQALLLKLIFLAEELLTEWDHEQLTRLTAGFPLPEGLVRDHFEDGRGLQPEVELRYLQDLGMRVDHPTSGPVQTSDLADCMFQLVHRLIGPDIADRFSGVMPVLAPGPRSSVFEPNPYAEQFSQARRPRTSWHGTQRMRYRG